MPNVNNRLALAAPFADLRPRRCLSSALAHRGLSSRMYHARQTALRLLGCDADAMAMTTVVVGARAAYAGEIAQSVVAEEFRELCLALDALTCRVRNDSENIEYIAKALCYSADESITLEGTDLELE